MRVRRRWLHLTAAAAWLAVAAVGCADEAASARDAAAATQPEHPPATQPAYPPSTQPGVPPPPATQPAPVPATAPATQPAQVRRVHVFVSGRVQGVGFRDFTAAHGNRLGLTGYVLNLRDGRVEAMIEGPAGKVDELLKLIARGPGPARVDRIEVADGPPTGEFRGFQVRR